ncbi:MAG TPA: hypothetical protein VKU35_00435, partial [Candidatus Limnocylindria bacterium]|nr:hypothetical protein [Candidatus Limnocylindria bacterium]
MSVNGGSWRRLTARAAMPVLAILVLAGCGGSSSTGGGLGSGPLLVGVLAPFSGADASFGPRYL